MKATLDAVAPDYRADYVTTQLTFAEAEIREAFASAAAAVEVVTATSPATDDVIFLENITRKLMADAAKLRDMAEAMKKKAAADNAPAAVQVADKDNGQN